ncbi:MAG: hypothetical protein J5616_02735 [Bacteroidaceae bacterium]|nr:hypothetical protein [Bacteroidaceae bacterium]
MRKLLFIVFIVFTTVSLQAFCEEKTMPINYVPQSEGFFAFTTGTDMKSILAYEYSLFKRMDVYNDKGRSGTYSTSHGKYISFSYVGEDNYFSSSHFWNETQQMAFYCRWNEFKLSAFTIDNDCVHLVDLISDNIIASFNIRSYPSDPEQDIKIMVFEGRGSLQALFLVINSWGTIHIYDSLPPSRVSSATADSPTSSRIYDVKGVQRNEAEDGLNIVRMSDGTTKKVMVK